MNDEKQFVPVILDREITSPNADAFGHRHFSVLMQGLIESSRNEPPYSIGLLGRWGSGKTSIKSLYLNSLADDVSPSSDHKSRSKRIHPITFNAWRFGGEDIKRALLRQVYLELGGDKNKLDEALFKHIHRSQPLSLGGWDRFKEAFGRSAFSLVVTVLMFAFVIGLAALIGWAFQLSGMTVMGVLGAIGLASAAAVVKFLLDSSQSTRHSTITQVDAPRSTAEQYEDFLIDQAHAFKQNNKSCERIVVFVDDLDRLSPEEMISGLDAVRTFMEIPKRSLPNDLGVVFVISCDEDRIADALADKRRRFANPDLPGAVFTHADAHRFLDRIFQFRLEIPPFPKRDMRNYAETAILKALPDLRKELEGIAVSLETLIDRMIHVGVGTPRNALQIVNAFIQSWWIAKRREREGAGTDSPGGLQEGAITKHPLALGAVCAMRVDFPDFYRDLQLEPELIRRFTDVFIRGVPLTEQPESVQHILLRYAQDGNGESGRSVRPEHRPLRQYIASLQGLRWPKAMRPLLFLSQDPVSRKYGDKALALYESFVSGDHVAVLAELGREHDSKKLSDADMRLIHEMVEELERETDVRRNNAAAVLAALGDRYPVETAHLLLSPLARRLAESPELRWRLGVVKIGRALGPVAPSDRREVAACLLSDLLKTSGRIEFRLESGEPPSLDEAMDMAREACCLLLQVRKNDGLSEQHQQELLSWLESRSVAVSDREQSLMFAEFEAWMSEHEEWLLPALGGRYTRMVLEQLEGDDPVDLNIEEVVRRCRFVFDALWNAGEDSRDELWAQITRFVAVEESAFVTLASEFVREHVQSPDEATISAIVAAFASRLQEESVPEGTEEFDLIAHGEDLVEITIKRRDDLEESCEKALADLIGSWSQHASTAQLSANLLSPVCEQFVTSSNSIITEWTGRLLSALPDPCIDWLACRFATAVSEQQRRQIIKRIAPIHQTDNIDQQQASQYQRFMQSLSEEAMATPEMKGHLDNTIGQVRQRHGNPNDYLRRVFPTIPRTLGSASPGQVGPMLSDLFANTKGDPSLFGWLHGQMADHWLAPSGDLPQYTPDRVFSDAREVASKQPAQASMIGALRTMTNMVRRRLVSDQRAADVVNVACQMWRHHRQGAVEALKSIEATPEPQWASAMVDGLPPNDDEAVTSLTDAWHTIAGRMDFDARVNTGLELLSKLANGTQDEPDLCLRLWITARDDDREQLLEALISASDLNDDQRRRVWLQIEQLTGLGTDFMFRVLPKVVGLNDSPQTVSELLDFEEQMTAKATSEDARYSLGQRLIEGFRASSSHEAKNRLAAWLKRLNVEPVIEELTKYGDLSDDEIAILDSQFKKSRHWKKVKPQ
jgi:hypothetical protein